VQPEVVSFSVGEVAQLSGVTVRTLHHYDELGLLSPTARTPAGYRIYSGAELVRLRRILFYRELGFPLDEIAAILTDPDVGDHLRHQHRLLRERIARLSAMVAALEKEMEAQQMRISLTPEEQFEIFGTDKAGGEWAQEAEQRWGDTDAHRQAARTVAYGKEEWLAIKAEGDAGLRDFADALRSGVPSDSPHAMDLAEAHRRHISRWFYDCGYDVHRGLAEMYVADERFAKHYEDVAPGLAQYVHDAITANADRAAGLPN
jgi:MerR family transcriptional regulator, thiopeptide resistance regulator